MILESVGTTFAGKCLRRSGSHCGQELAAASAGVGMDNAVMRASAMILLVNLFNFCNRSKRHPGSLPFGDCDFDDFFCCRICEDLNEG